LKLRTLLVSHAKTQKRAPLAKKVQEGDLVRLESCCDAKNA
jgi:hypothetical protein